MKISLVLGHVIDDARLESTFVTDLYTYRLKTMTALSWFDDLLLSIRANILYIVTCQKDVE